MERIYTNAFRLKKLKTLYVAGTPADEDAVTLAGVRGNGTKVIN